MTGNQREALSHDWLSVFAFFSSSEGKEGRDYDDGYNHYTPDNC
ncbi:hypothetical protein [Butyrivibrio sp.]|nr:hypothetical protein [Butyrivibrio sp.]